MPLLLLSFYSFVHGFREGEASRVRTGGSVRFFFPIFVLLFARRKEHGVLARHRCVALFFRDWGASGFCSAGGCLMELVFRARARTRVHSEALSGGWQ